MFTTAHFLLLFSLAFQIFVTIGMIYYSWSIIRLKVTPVFTWSFQIAAMTIQIIQIALSVLYINNIVLFLDSYPPATLMISYGLGALRAGLLFAFVYNVYKNLTLKFPPAPPIKPDPPIPTV